MKRALYLIVCVVFISILHGCGSSSTPRENVLKIYNWADYIDPVLLEEFPIWYEEQTGEKVEIVYQLFDINEVMLAKIEKGQADFDLACPSEYIIERMLAKDLLLPLNKDYGSTPDYTKNVSPYIIERFDNIVAPDGHNANDYAVGFMWGTTGFMYNARLVEREEVESWNAIFDPKFSKKLFIKDAFRDVYSTYLSYARYDDIIAGKVTRDELMFDTSDESIALVEGILKSARDNVLGWEADFGKEMMTQEYALLNLTWSGDAKWAIDEAAEVGVELDYVVPKEGSNVWFDGWVIPKYAVNQKAANYFINFMCISENAIRNMEEIGYVSVVGSKEVMEYMSESAQEAGFEEPMDYRYFFGDGAESIVMDPVMYPDSEVISRCAMMHDSGDRTEVLLEMWSRIKGDSLNTGMLSIIFITLGLLLFLGIYRKVKRARLRRQYLN